MKNIYSGYKTACCLLFLCSQQLLSYATTYYVAANGNDSNNGTASSTPFQTITKINSLTLNAGDQVLFRRGDVFRGQLNIARSGASGNPIIIDAYGTGNKPIISGSAVVTGWTNTSGNIWQATCAQAGTVITGVYSNSAELPLGRYPNYNAPNKGYNTVQSHSGNTQITSKETLATNWTGAEIVIRTMQWILDRSTITSQTGNVLNFNTTSYQPQDNWGYFIQNHPATLDQNGEWYYDPNTKKISIYSTQGNPGNQTIEATVFSKGINITGSFITIQNIQIEKTLNYALYGQNISNLTVLNSNMVSSGENGIQLDGSGNNVDIENDSIYQVNNNAVYVNNYSNFTFRGNSIRNIGLIPGRGKSGDGQYFGLQYAASNSGGTSLIENCVLDSMGYVGIDFRCSNITVQKNIVSNYDMTKDDGGGIYTWNGSSPANTYTNQHVISNIVYNAIGSTEGVYNGYAGACGIYMDDCSLNIEIKDNTVFNCAGEGLMLHGTNNINASGNTVFNNGTVKNGGQFLINMSDCGQTHDVTLMNNIFFSKQYYQEISRLEHQTTNLSTYGNFDNNFYCRPFDESTAIHTQFNGSQTSYSLACWQSSGYGKDPNSKITPVQFKPYSINTTGANLFSNGTFSANVNGLYCWASSSDCSTTWDNTGKLDGGSLKLTPGTVSPTLVVIGVGSVSASQDYILKFSLIGSDSCKSIGAYLRQSLSPYTNLTPTIYREIKTSRTENEILFSAPVTESNASIGFSVSSDAGPLWIDNISLVPAGITQASVDDSILFFYNDTKANKTFALPAGRGYIDVKQAFYSGSVQLAPFTSLILLYKQQIFTREENLPAADFSVAIHPNPATDQVNISYNLPRSGEVHIAVFDIMGKEMQVVTNEKQGEGEHRLEISTGRLQNGIYLVKINTEKNEAIKNLIINR